MDRRGFLTRAMGAGVAAVTTQLWLPPVSTAVAQPERRVFVPPRGGWGLPSAEDVANWWAGELNAWTPGDYTADISRLLRSETRYDVEIYGDLPFHVRPGDTVEVTFGPAQQTGCMIVQEIEQTARAYDAFTTRLRGPGVESYMFDVAPSIGTLRPDKGTVSRGLVEPRFTLTGVWD